MSAEDLVKLLHKFSIAEITHSWLDLDKDQRAVVTVEKKNSGAHKGRRSCVVCKGGLTEANQISVPMLLSVLYQEEKRDMYCYVLVCCAECASEVKKGGWVKKTA